MFCQTLHPVWVHVLLGQLIQLTAWAVHRLSNGAEEPVTTGDANRPLAVEDIGSSQHASSSHAHEDPSQHHAGSRNVAGQASRHHQHGSSAGEPSTSGRPAELTCRLVVDCMVRAVPDSPWSSLTTVLSTA